MNDVNEQICPCNPCPGAACECGCQTGQGPACKCGPECACGGACGTRTAG